MTFCRLGCLSHMDCIYGTSWSFFSFSNTDLMFPWGRLCGQFQKLHETAYPIKQTLFSRELGFAYVDLTQSGSTQFILNFHLSAWIWLLYYPHSTITPFVSSLSTFKLLYSNNEHSSSFQIEFLKCLDIKILSDSRFQLQLFRLKCHHGACFLDNTAVY